VSEKKSRQKSAVAGLSPTELAVAEAVLDGKNLREAAAIAGCTPQNAGNVVKKRSDVQGYLEEHRSELRNAAQIQRGDVITGFMDAIDLARLSADPGSMIRGWSEVGKMLGLYAPEKKEITITDGQRNIQSKFEIMSDEELLAIAEGRLIEGECTRV
jgi:hypothetical protein